MAGVERELGVEHGGADAEGLQEQAQAEARVDGVHEQQHLLAHQAQPQQHHHVQQPVLPGTGAPASTGFDMGSHLVRACKEAQGTERYGAKVKLFLRCCYLSANASCKLLMALKHLEC